MCGILLNISKEKISADHPALSVITHRGPDAFGMENFDLPDFCLSMGHRRLSIIDLSDKGKQPMSYDNGNLWITYNGEIYNYLEIRAELEGLGFQFKSDSDTEVLLAAFQKWGTKCLDKLNGMFAFAIFDRNENRLFIVRDRYGIKPIYFYNSQKGFILSSEIKQIAEFDYYPKSANKEALYHFLNSGDFSFNSETLWKDVVELEPGHLAEINLNTWKPGDSLNIQQWYSLPFTENVSRTEKATKLPFEDACCEFRRILDESVKLRLRADVNVGFLLSGGHDSSTLVGLAHENKRYENNKLRTYSSCYDDKSIDEREYIEAMVQFSGTDSFLHFPTPADFVENIDKVIWHNDIPVRMGSPAPHWLIYQYIKNEKDNRKVILEGQGADEILCGYGDFRWAALFEEMKFSNCAGFLSDFVSFQKRYHAPLKIIARKYFNMRYPDKIKYPASPMLNTDFLLGAAEIPSLPLKREASTVSELHKERMKILRYILHNVDRGSMAHSRETRVPFLDHNLVEFCLKLPSEYKMKGGVSKRVLRESVRDILPDKINKRVDKQGYSSPVQKWAGNELKEFFKDNLRKAQDLPFVNKKQIEKTFASFSKGDTPFNPILWRIIAVNKWINMFKIGV
jgi:asparagine synthase (glutamine-hydrolysing)